MRRAVLLSCLGMLFAMSVAARDVYVLQGYVTGASFGLESTIWSTDTLFYNSGPTDESVTLLGISNGIDPVGRVGETLLIPSRRTVSLQQATSWVPAIPLVMLHLNAPDAVIVQDVLFVGSQENVGVSGTADPRKYGKVALPVFTTLAPPNTPQIHLETDIGKLEGHLNVGIYNAADRTATAVIQTRAHCDDGVVSQMTVSVPANTVVQFGPFQTDTGRCHGNLVKSMYTEVTVDEPSLTFVSALANTTIPTTSISISGT